MTQNNIIDQHNQLPTSNQGARFLRTGDYAARHWEYHRCVVRFGHLHDRQKNVEVARSTDSRFTKSFTIMLLETQPVGIPEHILFPGIHQRQIYVLLEHLIVLSQCCVDVYKLYETTSLKPSFNTPCS